MMSEVDVEMGEGDVLRCTLLASAMPSRDCNTIRANIAVPYCQVFSEAN